MTMNVLECYDLWHQARAIHPDDPKRQNAAFMEALVAFAELVAAAEREACARVAGRGGDSRPATDPERYLPGARKASQVTATAIAAAIRARGAA
jgi:hypothetical protein